MKATLLASCFLCATAALGQSGITPQVLNNQPQMVHFPSHSQLASEQPLAPGRNLQEKSGFAYAQGERPLWEFAPRSSVAPVSSVTPLGDIARQLRKEHATDKKADIVWAD
jgi:hypothetical protein